MIPYGRQDISQADIDAVIDVLKSDWLTQGPMVGLFEKAVADYCGATHAVAVNSGTSALHIACLALGLGPGDYLWTSPNTFVASANCALYCGATVDFVDIDRNTWNLDVSALKDKLEIAQKEGKLPKVVVPVHFAGQSCEMKEIAKLSRQYGFKILEDASHAIGGQYDNKPIGSCRYSDITVFSFHPVKIITTGEGGMAMTNDNVLAEKMRRLSTHGITRHADEMTKESEGAWHYQQIELGFNYRLTDIQSALGLQQLQRLDDFVSARQILAKRYNQLLADMPLSVQWNHPDTYSAYHLYTIRINQAESRQSRQCIFDRMRQSGVGVNVHYIPVHTQPYYEGLGFRQGDFPEAEKYYTETISLPLFPALTNEEQDIVVLSLKEAMI